MNGWSRQKQKLLRTNWMLTIAAVVVAFVGVLFVYSGSFLVTNEPSMRYQKQIVWVLAGFVVAGAMVLVDYRDLEREAVWIYLGALGLLVATLLFGTTLNGSRRWLTAGGISLQTSEIAKVALILVLAWYLSRPETDLTSFRTVGLVLLIAGVPAALIAKQPDLGSALVLPAIAFTMMFGAGVSVRWLLLIVGLGLGLALVVLSIFFLPRELGCSPETQTNIIHSAHLKVYQRQRLETFIDPRRDPTGAGWNRLQSEIAIGSGGYDGKGFRKGTSNLLGFLPKIVAPSDFIFAVVAEEEGFLGSVGLLLLYVIILGGVLWAGMASVDKQGRLICVGVAGFLFTHVSVNVAMTMGLLPIVGIPLPLMSCGGTFVVSVLMSLGLVQGVYVRRRLARY